MDKNALASNFEKTQVPQKDRTDKIVIARPEMNLQTFKGNSRQPKIAFQRICNCMRENSRWVPWVLLKIYFCFATVDELKRPFTLASVTSATQQVLYSPKLFSAVSPFNNAQVVSFTFAHRPRISKNNYRLDSLKTSCYTYMVTYLLLRATEFLLRDLWPLRYHRICTQCCNVRYRWLLDGVFSSTATSHLIDI